MAGQIVEALNLNIGMTCIEMSKLSARAGTDYAAGGGEFAAMAALTLSTSAASLSLSA